MFYKEIADKAALFTIFLACIFWFIIFRLQLFNFWYSMAVAATILASLAVIFGGKPFKKREINIRAVIIGVLSAVILYGIFWLGNFMSSILFSFAPTQVQSIYNIRTEGEIWLITIILLFVTSPAEEIFWRGFLQRWLEQKVTKWSGWILAGTLYSGVHIFSGNFMLIMAALVAGIFWAFIYAVEKSTVPLIISHALWTVLIFVIFPIT